MWHVQRGPQRPKGLQFPQECRLQNISSNSPNWNYTSWEADLSVWHGRRLAAEVELGISNIFLIPLLYTLANMKATWPQSGVQKICTPETFRPLERERNRKGSSVLFANVSLWSPWHHKPRQDEQIGKTANQAEFQVADYRSHSVFYSLGNTSAHSPSCMESVLVWKKFILNTGRMPSGSLKASITIFRDIWSSNTFSYNKAWHGNSSLFFFTVLDLHPIWAPESTSSCPVFLSCQGWQITEDRLSGHIAGHGIKVTSILR